MRNISLMDGVKIAGFLVAIGMAFLTWKASYDRFNEGQAAMLAQLSGIHEQVTGINTRLSRVEEAVFPVPRTLTRDR